MGDDNVGDFCKVIFSFFGEADVDFEGDQVGLALDSTKKLPREALGDLGIVSVDSFFDSTFFSLVLVLLTFFGMAGLTSSSSKSKTPKSNP